VSEDGPLHEWSVSAIADAVRGGVVSAQEVTLHHLARIEARQDLNAFITVDADRALAAARALDERGAFGKLSGVPFAAKDTFDTAGITTTYGSQIFRRHVPAKTAVAVQRLLDAGGILIGKANLNEFARGVTTRNPYFGACLNPRRPGFTPAGSSGGNAAALAAGLVALGLATDAGGSIRTPSAACGTAGYKPQFGQVPLEGCFGLAAPFDHAGPMARSMNDCVVAMEVLVGLGRPPSNLTGRSIGLVAPIAGVDRLTSAGARVEEARIPSFDHLIPLHMAEFAITHLRLFAKHGDSYSAEAAEMINRGRAVAPATYRALQRELDVWRRDCQQGLSFDLVAGPAFVGDPPLLDEPETTELLLRISHCTRPYNLLGWPSAVTRDGVMFAGRSDTVVLAAALAWEDMLEDVPSTC
jgi:Asp-tRNA(Asn)/Glu-tRNA(Gln) amidotransferase A subunit family amidase